MPFFQEGFSEKIFTLSEVTASIKRTLTSRYGSSFWLRAEMVKLNFYPYSGHAFPDLIEKEDERIVAQMRSVIWGGDLRRIREKFRRAGLGEPRDGMCVLVRANIVYDAFYGLSLRISDADVGFTLGELEKERLLCIERLRNEGLYSLNKSRSLPMLPKRFALISVESSKGYGDFLGVLGSYGESYGFFHYLFPSLLQGEGAIGAIIEALSKVVQVKDFFDAVLIIRGGGGDIGLNCYNNYELCRAVALCPLPVLTGIGHSSNTTVCEEIAWHSSITPTDLADYLVGFSIRAEQSLKDAVKRLKQHYESRIEREKNAVEIYSKLLRLLSVELTLEKGYTITGRGGKPLLSCKDVKHGDEIETRFFDGTIKSKVL